MNRFRDFHLECLCAPLFPKRLPFGKKLIAAPDLRQVPIQGRAMSANRQLPIGRAPRELIRLAQIIQIYPNEAAALQALGAGGKTSASQAS